VLDGVTVYNGTADVGAFTPATTLGVMQCGFSTFFDFISSSSAATLVWSWELAQPANGFGCASVNFLTGRWTAEDCGDSHLFACRSNSDYTSWTVGSVYSTRVTYDDNTICPPGYSFATPRTAGENTVLATKLANSKENVWISMNMYPNGTWSDVPTHAAATTSGATRITCTLALLIVGFIVNLLYI